MTGQPTDEFDTSRPHLARMYDWYLGGKDNHPVDEEMGRTRYAAAIVPVRPTPAPLGTNTGPAAEATTSRNRRTCAGVGVCPSRMGSRVTSSPALRGSVSWAAVRSSARRSTTVVKPRRANAR